MKTAHRKAARGKRRYIADPMSFYRVMGRAEPFSEEHQRQLTLPVRMAYDGFLKSAATEPDYHTLAAAVNIAMICSERIDPLVQQSCIAGRDAMLRVWNRFLATAKWGLDGPAIAELEQVVDIYEQLASLLTGGQLQAAMVECFRRMEQQTAAHAAH